MPVPPEKILDVRSDPRVEHGGSGGGGVWIERGQALGSEDVERRHGYVIPRAMPQGDKPRDFPLNTPGKSPCVHGLFDACVVGLFPVKIAVRLTDRKKALDEYLL